jgi:acyl carrier protein
MKPTEPLTFEAFRAMVADLLQVDMARVTPEAYFVTDLGVDSLRMLQILLRLEKLGLAFSLEAAFQIQTVADAYHYYQQSSRRV